MRNSLLERLRKRGNHYHNMTVMKEGKGELIVEKSPGENSTKPHTDYLYCDSCFGWYYRVDLHRHTKTCSLRSIDRTKTYRVQGVASMMFPISPEISPGLKIILAGLILNDISHIVKTDPLIIKYGNAMVRKHLNDDDQSKYIRNKLRELGRLVLKLKGNACGVNGLVDIINPAIFSNVIEATTEMCGWDAAKKNGKNTIPWDKNWAIAW